MDGVHDMGGTHGFGPVDPEDDHPLVDGDWRARMFGIEISFTQPGGFNLDWMRHVMECMPPAAYLSSEYYDRWYWREVGILANAGWVTVDELKSGVPESVPDDAGDPLPPEAVPVMLDQGLDSHRPPAGPDAFSVGDTVRAKFTTHIGATRLPRYVRGHTGRIEAKHGWHVLPDASAHGDDKAEPLYNVSFLARDLWDDVSSPKDRVFLDLWESYLEPA